MRKQLLLIVLFFGSVQAMQKVKWFKAGTCSQCPNTHSMVSAKIVFYNPGDTQFDEIYGMIPNDEKPGWRFSNMLWPVTYGDLVTYSAFSTFFPKGLKRRSNGNLRIGRAFYTCYEPELQEALSKAGEVPLNSSILKKLRISFVLQDQYDPNGMYSHTHMLMGIASSSTLISK